MVSRPRGTRSVGDSVGEGAYLSTTSLLMRGSCDTATFSDRILRPPIRRVTQGVRMNNTHFALALVNTHFALSLVETTYPETAPERARFKKVALGVLLAANQSCTHHLRRPRLHYRLLTLARAGPGPELAQGHRVSRPRGTGSVGDSVGSGRPHLLLSMLGSTRPRLASSLHLLPLSTSSGHPPSRPHLPRCTLAYTIAY